PRLPVTVGLNWTLMVQLAPAAREAPQVGVCEKSPAAAPVMVKPVIVSAVVPMLVSVMSLAAVVVPTVTEPKFKLVGASLAVVPTPLSGINCGLPAALSATLRDALRVPMTRGVKVMLKVHLAPAAREAPQV